MNSFDENLYVDSKKLPKEYLILKLRKNFNKELYERKVIDFDIYNKMQNMILKKMDKLALDYKV